MGRRVSNGVVGSSGTIGQLSVTGNTLTTTQTNTNLIIDPQGTGLTEFVGNIRLNAAGELRLADGDSSNYIALKATSNVTTNRTLTFPDSVGSAGNVLQTDGSGNLSWVSQTTAGITANNYSSSSTIYYPAVITNGGSLATGQITSIEHGTALQFQPSSGTLTSAIGSHANLIGGTSGGGTITIRGTSNASKATASVLMTDGVSSSSTGTGTLVVTGGVGVSGQVTCATLSATTVTETSSIVLKENIQPIDDALAKIMQLRGVTYDRIDGTSNNEAGLIAEWVYETLPNLITKDAAGNIQGIKYTKIIAYLVEAVKTLKLELEQVRNN